MDEGETVRPVGQEQLSGRQREAARRLILEATTVEVVGAFRKAGIEPILLKGPALEAWLYDQQPRYYGDADLLVAPDRYGDAEQVLRALGYVPQHAELAALQAKAVQAEPHAHAQAWKRPTTGVEIDLHRSLDGVGVDDEAVWSLLERRTRPYQLLDETVRVPDVPVLALHLALHATQDRNARSRKYSELERAIKQTPLETWRATAGVAEELDAAEVLGLTLRQVPGGTRLAEELLLPAPTSLDQILRGSGGPAEAVTVAYVTAHKGWVGRLAYALRKALPSPAFLRARWPDLPSGPTGLLWGYARRWVWLARRARPALRAYWQARRAGAGPWR